jgi:hypothetical protein
MTIGLNEINGIFVLTLCYSSMSRRYFADLNKKGSQKRINEIDRENSAPVTKTQG